MSMCMNKVCLLGNVGHNPDSRDIASGTVVSFSMATSDTWTDKEGQRKERTEWHKVMIYNEVHGALAMDHLRKGSRIYIEGQLQTRKWTDPEGIERQLTMIVLGKARAELVLLDPKAA